ARVGTGPCEALLGGLSGVTGLGWAVGLLPGRLVPLLLGMAWLGVAAGTVDVLHRRLPDALTMPAIPAGLLLLCPAGSGAVVRGVAGAVVALSAYGTVHLVAPAALGAGDVKLAGSLGAALAGLWWPAPLLAAMLAGVVTLVLALLTRQAVVPHGPGLLAGSWVVAWPASWLAATGAPHGGAVGG
ncbi:MAG TPA: prepilin peptidase, partial [Pseudonocardia sp.]|nr:prepilin peptidase [Pseudonocardia sp.]